MTDRDLDLPADYGDLVEDLKRRVRSSRLKAQRTVNTQLIELYWSLGHAIRQANVRQGWGSRVIHRIAEDLRAEFPEMRGFSARNLQYMATFAGTWAAGSIAQQPVAQLPGGMSPSCSTSSITMLTGRNTPQQPPSTGGRATCCPT